MQYAGLGGLGSGCHGCREAAAAARGGGGYPPPPPSLPVIWFHLSLVIRAWDALR